MNCAPFLRLHPCFAPLLLGLLVLGAAAPSTFAAEISTRRILLVAGPKSHDSGAHEHPAGVALLAEALNRAGLPLAAEAFVGWPADATVATADLLVIYSDGQAGHAAKGRAVALRQRLTAGKALAVLHYALEPDESDTALKQALLDAIGGCFEVGWSVNPVWLAKGAPTPSHPAARGVGPLAVEDEWYFHLRFRDGLRGVEPVFAALPPAEVVAKDGPRSGNPTVRAAVARGEAQVLAWTCRNESGARGFGFTGGHFHRLWYDDNYRRLVLNGLVWAAGLDVPAGGVATVSPSAPLHATIDEAVARGDAADVQRHLNRDPALARGLPGAKLAPLHQAILRRKPEIVALLLTRGADVNAPDSSGRTPLHLAVERADAGLVQELLARRADPGRRDRIGWTPLHHAAAKNQVAIARLLLDGGADPNRLSELGGTALHEAAAGAGAEMVQLLLERGIDPAVRSKPGVTALDLAREYKNTAAIELLERRRP
jgi:ankyrin repeat protein